MVQSLEYWYPSWFSSSRQMLFHTSHFFIFSTKCLIRKAATEYFRSGERKRMTGLKEAIHTCGGKVIPLTSAQQMTIIFFICNFTLMSPGQYYQIFLLYAKLYLLNVVHPPVSFFTHFHVCKIHVALSRIHLLGYNIYGLLLYFSCRFSVWIRRKIPSFFSATCCLKSIVQVFPGSDIYHHKNIARQV